jgi:nitrite reductase (cytochrome c-552)
MADKIESESSQNESHQKFRPVPLWFYAISMFGVALMTFGIMLLWQNITERKMEARETSFKLVDVTEDTVDPEVWAKNFPRQYDGYKRTVDTVRTRHGGSEAFQKLDEDPRWRRIFAGYAFSRDYREERGHAYMLQDQDETKRVTDVKQTGSCLHCHASVMPAYRKMGKEAGVSDSDPHAQVMKGFDIVNAMEWKESRKLVTHPVSCVDCHDPENMHLRVTRPAFLVGIQNLAKSNDPVPHLVSIERWRKGDKSKPYDVNAEATRQEMRSLVCAQCHVEYHFKGKKERTVTYPWHKGLKAEQIEAYYDEIQFKDWAHKESGAPSLKAQHPEFELWSQGIHARSGVSCADCHMPYMREGAIKISDHHIRSPLLNIARACQTCHNYDEGEIKARAEAIQDRTHKLLIRGEESVVDLIGAIAAAQKAGASEAQLKTARDLQRKAQWRLDFIAAENSMGFHASQESARVLAEAIDYARQGQLAALKWKTAVPTKSAATPSAAKS